MKKIGSIFMCMFIGFTFLLYPTNIDAEDLDVGVTINNPVVIDVETTISANAIVDVEKKQSIPSYIHCVNNGTTPINLSITNIAAVGTDSPDAFVAYNTTEPVTGKTWLDLNEIETKEYVSFGISYGENETYQSILPNTTLNLGTVKYYDPQMGVPPVNNNEATESMSYSLITKTGFNWGATRSLSYRITFVAEVAGTYTYPNASKHAGINGNINIGGTLNSNDLTLVASFDATSDYVLPNNDKVMIGTKIISPSGNSREYPPSAVDSIIPDTVDTTTHYEISRNISDYTFSETGTYYVVVYFGFADEEGSFSPSSNYSQVISFTK